MKTSVAIGGGLIAIGTALSAYAGQTKPDAKFCQAVAAYQNDAAALQAIGPHSTLAELRAARDRVDNDVQQMRQAAWWMHTPASKRFSEAVDRLDKDINDVPDDATVAQVRGEISGDVQNARDAGRQVAAEAGCPVPQQQE